LLLLSLAVQRSGAAAEDHVGDLFAAGRLGCVGDTVPQVGVVGPVTLSSTSCSASLFAPIVAPPSMAGALSAAQSAGCGPAM